jgi:cell division septation protein DedD
MRNNETGEYELVVGNKQLLSGFFIVVLLCAVAFAMGYVVGENSHSVKAPELASAAGAGKVVDPRPEAASPGEPPGRPEVADPIPTNTKEAATPQPTTRPARDPEPETPRRKPPEPKAAAPQPTGTPETAPGQFWQVTATTNRDSAENLLQSLREKGFPAVLSPGPNNFTRVLVGPYPDTTTMGKAKTELEGAGFSKLVRK